MNTDERKWIEEALVLAKRAQEQGVSLVLYRGQDANGEADILLTNVPDAAFDEDVVWEGR